MARYSDTIDTTEQAIRDFADNLRNLAADFDKRADEMKEHGLQSIAVTHWKSARDGVAGYAAFAAAVKKALVISTQMSAVNALLKDSTQQASDERIAEEMKQAPQKPKRSRGGKS